MFPKSTEAPPPPAGEPTEEERNVATLCHIGGVLSLGLAPFLMWQLNKDKSAFVVDQAKEAVNFQLTVLIPVLVGLPLLFLMCLGAFLVLPALVFSLVYGIQASMAASAGKAYRYPYTLRLIA